jgi:hypothetical protein
MQYVGETKRSFLVRYKEHRRDIAKHRRSLGKQHYPKYRRLYHTWSSGFSLDSRSQRTGKSLDSKTEKSHTFGNKCPGLKLFLALRSQVYFVCSIVIPLTLISNPENYKHYSVLQQISSHTLEPSHKTTLQRYTLLTTSTLHATHHGDVTSWRHLVTSRMRNSEETIQCQHGTFRNVKIQMQLLRKNILHNSHQKKTWDIICP